MKNAEITTSIELFMNPSLVSVINMYYFVIVLTSIYMQSHFLSVKFTYQVNKVAWLASSQVLVS